MNHPSQDHSTADQYKYDLDIERTINYFSNSLFAQHTEEDILWDVVTNCIAQLDFEDCVIYLFNEDGTRLIQKAAYGPKGTSDNRILNPIEIPLGEGIVGSVAITGIEENISDTSADDRYIADDMFRFSELAVPVVFDGKVIGVIDSEHSEKNFFSEKHIRVLKTIASLSATKIMKARLDEAIRKNEMQLVEANRKMAEAKLTALRSQMNPHFIFNCLGAIQDYMLNENQEKANKYLTLFSRFLRMVMEDADKSEISIAKELRILQLYLELESTRLKNQFSFSVEVDEALRSDEVFIPTFILQPFVDNAIWHGLMNKSGDRHLGITMKATNDTLVCCIEDNGVGRKWTHENDSKHRGPFLTKGIELTEERLTIMRQLNNHPATGMEIVDLFLPNGEPGGTKVVVKLPLITAVRAD